MKSFTQGLDQCCFKWSIHYSSQHSKCSFSSLICYQEFKCSPELQRLWSLDSADSCHVHEYYCTFKWNILCYSYKSNMFWHLQGTIYHSLWTQLLVSWDIVYCDLTGVLMVTPQLWLCIVVRWHHLFTLLISQVTQVTHYSHYSWYRLKTTGKSGW